MARYRRKTRRHRKKSRNMFNKTLNQSVSVVKTTSKRYMPKVKHGLENVGSSVVKSGQQSVPYLQRLTRKFFGKLGVKSKKNRRG